MLALIEGEIRRRETTGFGPFKRTTWEAEPFRLRFSISGEIQEIEDCRFERIDRNGRIYLNATINGIPCYIADVASGEVTKAVDFNLLSVAGIELHGKAMLLPSPKIDAEELVVKAYAS